jgi:hypothetical protein
MEEDEFAFGVGVFGFDVGDRGRGVLFCSGCDVYFGIVRVEDCGEFLAYAGRRACDNEYLRRVNTN